MHLRRSAAALVLAACLATGLAPAAVAEDNPSPATGDIPEALFGDGDPRHDAVWRQSVALLAQHAVGERPLPRAVAWLVDQQCDDGSFRAYRPDPDKPCGATARADVNATAAAVQALARTGGHRAEVDRSVRWLRSVQNADGGWGYAPDSPSDANSVAVVLGALTAAGEEPESVRPRDAAGDADQPSPYDALLDFQLGCEAPTRQRGAFAYQPDEDGRRTADNGATVAAVTAALGEGLAAEPAAEEREAPRPVRCTGRADQPPARTPARAAEVGAAYLIRTLRQHDWHLRSTLPGGDDQPDFGNTALAAVALAAAGHRDAARHTVTWLERHAKDWQGLADNPAGLGYLILAAQAADADPRAFGDTDLTARLRATGPPPRQHDGTADSGSQARSADPDSPLSFWWLVGGGLLAGAGVGWALSRRAVRRGD